jgi:hypothetical protein
MESDGNETEWCNADMVQEERRSWQVQDGRVEAEWCYGKSAGLRQVQDGRGEAEWRNGKEWVEAATESDGEEMRRKVRRKSGCARRGMVRREERRSWQMREEMGEATPNGVTGRTQVVAGREERRMVGEEERKWQVQDG